MSGWKDYMEVFTCFILGMPKGCDQRGWVVVRQVPVVCTCNRVGIPDYGHSQRSLNPRRACAARVTPCVCVSVCPGLASATHATTRPSRHTYGLSIVLAPELIWKIAIALPYSRAHGSRPFLYAKRAHFPHSFRILRS